MSRLNSDDPRVSNTPRVLAWLALALLPAFAVTTAVTQSYRSEQRDLAAEWFAQGEAALGAGRPAEAIASFHNALTFSRENQLFRLRLAQALAADGRTAEARAYLLTLWEVQPGSGEVNLALARLAGRDGDVGNAQRYYRHAIEGAWGDAAETRRRTVRLELASFLIEQKKLADARAELVALQGDLPPDTASLHRIADLMLDAGLPAHAGGVYTSILEREPDNARALAGAGRVAFERAEYAEAVRFLSRAAKKHDDEAAGELLSIAQLVLSADPYQRRLPLAARVQRAQQAVDAAAARLTECDAQQNSPGLLQLRAELQALGSSTAARVSRNMESIDTAMDVVFRIEQATAAACGPPTQPLDRALLRLAEHTRGGP